MTAAAAGLAADRCRTLLFASCGSIADRDIAVERRVGVQRNAHSAALTTRMTSNCASLPSWSGLSAEEIEFEVARDEACILNGPLGGK